MDDYIKAGRQNNPFGRLMARAMGRDDPKSIVARKLNDVEEKQREIRTYISNIQQIARETGAVKAIKYRSDQLSGKEGW